MEQSETLQLAERDDALIVTINRPAALNALSLQVVADLEELLERVSASGYTYRALVITGAGEKSFVAGADIVQMNSMTPEEAEAYGRRMHAVTEALENLQIPVIAAVNGFALGGGCELALACDFIYASENASFAQPEVNLGLVPGFGGSVRLPRRIGPAQARELIFTGRRIKAAEALRIGLVNKVVPADQLLDTVFAVVAELSAVAPTAVGSAKSVINQAEAVSVHDGLELEAQSFGAAFTTEDSVEGRSAFVQKRTADFPGR